MFTWPIVVALGIFAAMILTLVLTGHGSAVWMSTAALVSVGTGIAHAFLARAHTNSVEKKRREVEEEKPESSG